MRGLIYALAALPAIDAFKTLGISRNGRCGADFGLTCKGSQYGNCCSQYNYCGRSSDYCSPNKGCQPGFGDCSGASTYPPSPPPAYSKVSTDGTCGGSKGYTCLNSRYGNCCSRYGYCGSTKDYCGTGCNPLFGSCSSSGPSSFLTSSTKAGEPIHITVTSVVTQPTTLTLPCEEATVTTTKSTTETTTLPQTTITIPGEGEVTTVTVPTTVTIPDEPVTTTITVPGEDVTTTITIPGEAEVITVTIPGEPVTTTITVPGEGVTTTITIPGEGEVTTVTIPGEPVTTTVTVPGEGVTTTITIPGEAEVITVSVPVPGPEVTVTTCAAQNPPGPALPTQVVGNPGFESTAQQSAPWQPNDGECTNVAGTNNNPAHSGARNFRCGALTNTHFSFYQTVNLKPGATYQFELWARTDVLDACSLDPVSLGGMSKELTNKQLSVDAWSPKTAVFQIPQGMTSGQLVIGGRCVPVAGSGRLYFDDITLTEQF